MRRWEFVDGLKGPPLFTVGDGHAAEGGCGLGDGFGTGIVGTGGDPGFEVINDVLGELAGGRHLELGVGVFEGGEEAGGGDFAEAGLGVQDEIAHRGFEFRVVAAVTTLDEDGADFGFEESGVRLGEKARGGKEEECPDHAAYFT